MEIREFSGEQLRQVYLDMLPEDFPPAEIKPHKMVWPLIDQGLYTGYGYYDQNQLCAYAMFVHAEHGRYMLLDYFAVRRAYRSGGYGGCFIAGLGAYCHGYDGLIGEIENPDFAQDETDAAIRSRRLAFYQRNGWRLTGLRARLIGVEYSIIARDFHGRAADMALRAELERIYRTMFKPTYYQLNVLIYPPQ